MFITNELQMEGFSRISLIFSLFIACALHGCDKNRLVADYAESQSFFVGNSIAFYEDDEINILPESASLSLTFREGLASIDVLYLFDSNVNPANNSSFELVLKNIPYQWSSEGLLFDVKNDRQVSAYCLFDNSDATFLLDNIQIRSFIPNNSMSDAFLSIYSQDHETTLELSLSGFSDKPLPSQVPSIECGELADLFLITICNNVDRNCGLSFYDLEGNVARAVEVDSRSSSFFWSGNKIVRVSLCYEGDTATYFETDKGSPLPQGVSVEFEEESFISPYRGFGTIGLRSYTKIIIILSDEL